MNLSDSDLKYTRLKRELKLEVSELAKLIADERWNTAMSVAGYIITRLKPYANDEKSKKQ